MEGRRIEPARRIGGLRIGEIDDVFRHGDPWLVCVFSDDGRTLTARHELSEDGMRGVHSMTVTPRKFE